MTAAGAWQLDRLSREAKAAAETAAAEAGLSLAEWLRSVILEQCAAEGFVTPRERSVQAERPSLSIVAAEKPGASRASTPAQAALAALSHNLRQVDYPAIAEARAYLSLLIEHGLEVAEITAATGRERSRVAQALRLLGLPEEVQRLIDDRSLGADLAFVLLDAEDPQRFAAAILAEGLTAEEARRRLAEGAP